MPRLFVLPQVDGDAPFELEDHMVLVGREPDSLLQIEDRNISKHHALLLKVDDSYRVFDLHSSNGTYVNEERITMALLKDGDVVQFGAAQFRFESGPARKKVGLKTGVGGVLNARPLSSQPSATPVAASAPAPERAVPLPAKPASTPLEAVAAAKALTAKPMGLGTQVPEIPPSARPPSVPIPVSAAQPQVPPAVPVATPTEEPKVKVMIPRKPMGGLPAVPVEPAKVSDAKETQDAAPAAAKLAAKPAAGAKPILGARPLVSSAAAVPPAPPAAVPAPAPAAPPPAPAAAPTPPPASATKNPPAESPAPVAEEDPTKPKRFGLGGRPAGGGGEMRLKLKR